MTCVYSINYMLLLCLLAQVCFTYVTGFAVRNLLINCPSNIDSNSIVSALIFLNASSDYPYKGNVDSLLHFTFRNQLSIITQFIHKTHFNEDNEVCKSEQLI
jgi:hypothetical protein